MSGRWARLAKLDDVAPGSSHMVDHERRKVLIVRLGDDELRAYDGRCPHANTPLAPGPLVSGVHIECPMHGALFRADDGGLDPSPITCPALTAWPVRLTRDGHVEVDVPEPPAEPRAGARPVSWGAIGDLTAAARNTSS